MKRMDVCLRQWQLGKSAYGDLDGYPERPSEPAAVGSIVHDLLSHLFCVTAQAGYPPLGSEPFRQVLLSAQILERSKRALEAFASRARVNPRADESNLRNTARDIYNHVAIAFQDEYRRIVRETGRFVAARPSPPETAAEGRLTVLERQGMLSEEHVKHPQLPLIGIIDLLAREAGETVVLDFKTGQPQPHYAEQVRLYALLWWRSTGDLPTHVELRYGARVDRSAVSREDLEALEKHLEAKIALHTRGLGETPARATQGAHCSNCHVRALCDVHWETADGAGLERAIPGNARDEELIVERSGASTGFEAITADKRRLTVVYEEDVGAKWGPFVSGETLRCMSAFPSEDPSVLRIARSTEVFRSAEPR